MIDGFYKKCSWIQIHSRTVNTMKTEDRIGSSMMFLNEIMVRKRKRIFQMSRKKGMNNEEIANELHISKRTVENHLTQALKDIRKIISLLILIIH